MGLNKFECRGAMVRLLCVCVDGGRVLLRSGKMYFVRRGEWGGIDSRAVGIYTEEWIGRCIIYVR